MATSEFACAATPENFPRLVLENSRRGLVLVDFRAPWAGPSFRQRELLLKLVRDFELPAVPWGVSDA